jgi:hypothetical protein
MWERASMGSRAVGIGAVSPRPLDGDTEVVRGSVHRPGLDAEGTPRNLRVDVRGHDGIRLPHQGSLSDYQIGPRRVGLLAGLKEGEEGFRQGPLDPSGGPEQGNEGGHVNVVAARVHRAAGGGEGRARLFLDRQGVQLGPYRDGLPGRPDPRHQARAEDALHILRPESLHNEAGGGVLPMARLGRGVQTLAQPDGVWKLVFQGSE